MLKKLYTAIIIMLGLDCLALAHEWNQLMLLVKLLESLCKAVVAGISR